MDQELKAMPYHGQVPCKYPECECANCPGHKIHLTIEFNAWCLMMHLYVPFIFTWHAWVTFVKVAMTLHKGILYQIQRHKMLLFTQRQPWRKRLPYAQRHDWRKIFPLGIRAILRQSLHDHCASDSGHHVYRFTEEQLWWKCFVTMEKCKEREWKVLDYSGSEEVEVVDLCWLVLHSYRSKFYLILLLPLCIKF